MALVSAGWGALGDEIARWRDAGRAVEFWWRDDDATTPSHALKALLDLSARTAVPVALAVVPLAASAELFTGLRSTVLMHGTDHRNRGAAGEKKTEFPADEPDGVAVERLRNGRDRLAALAGSKFAPVLAPPWNRFKPGLVSRLGDIGLRGLSVYGPRAKPEAAPGIAEVNTHVDLIDWRGTRGFAGEEVVLAGAAKHLAAKRSGVAEGTEPTGWLSHHALHDAATRDFLERLFDRTRGMGARWLDAQTVFFSSS